MSGADFCNCPACLGHGATPWAIAAGINNANAQMFEAMQADTAALREFFYLCWDYARGFGGESDGGDIQEWGEKLGLLKKVVASAPCGDGCVCAEYVGDDFPTDCYRPTFVRADRPSGVGGERAAGEGEPK